MVVSAVDKSCRHTTNAMKQWSVLWRKMTDLLYTKCWTWTNPSSMSRISAHGNCHCKVCHKLYHLSCILCCSEFSITSLLINVSYVIKTICHSTFCSSIYLQYFKPELQALYELYNTYWRRIGIAKRAF